MRAVLRLILAAMTGGSLIIPEKEISLTSDLLPMGLAGNPRSAIRSVN